MLTTLIYNSLMLLVDVFVLRRLHAKRSIVAAGLLAVAAALVGAVAALLVARDRFDILRLAAWAIFAHGVILSLGTAAILWPTRRFWAIFAAAMATALSLIAIDAFLVEPRWLEVSHVTIASPKLSRPCRVVVLADFQAEEIGPYDRMVLRRVAEAQPDVVLLAGDYLQPSPARYDAVLAELRAVLREANLAAHARVFAVRGDMEGPRWRQIFQGLNFTTASGTESFDLGGGLLLTCLPLEASINPATRISAVPDRFHLVLGHSPNYALGDVAADLLVAGHTHGGQVRLPWIGSLMTLSQIPRRWAAGLTDLPEGRRLLVSRGVGMERGNAPRLRFLCRPELVVLDLKPGREPLANVVGIARQVFNLPQLPQVENLPYVQPR
jgi:uncharacterized protein